MVSFAIESVTRPLSFGHRAWLASLVQNTMYITVLDIIIDTIIWSIVKYTRATCWIASPLGSRKLGVRVSCNKWHIGS